MAFVPALAAEDYCYLTTTGRVSGEPREIEIWFALEGGVALHAVRRAATARTGCRNLLKDPSVSVRIGDERLAGRARVVRRPPRTPSRGACCTTSTRRATAGDLDNWRQNALPVAIDFD